MQLRGLFRLLFLYDVAESIDLSKLRNLLGARVGSSGQAFPRRTPGYVRFEDPPVLEMADCISVAAGGNVACPVKYYGFGAIVIQVEVPFDCDMTTLVEQSSRWMDAADVEPLVRELVLRRLEQIRPAVTRATEDWLQENYLVVEIHKILDERGMQPAADELITSYGGELVQLIRGETTMLARHSIDEALQSSLSYYPSDLALVGSHGAVVVDGPEDAAAVTQILEYAKMQLLEFRYYDRFLTRVLADFYLALERKRNILTSRLTLPRESQHFNTIRLDVMELTERIDNAIKFVSDIYYARVYRLAATRMGVEDYRNLVDQKLDTFGELYDSMVDRFNETRSFVLELLVAILAVLDVIFLFRDR
ncbi:MAG TPA: hypothetical protein VG272_08835 [Candidatus Acidoferrales bacterium]|nr:hypothetical protein [Candidatus Acidoferrales bacterium]